MVRQGVRVSGSSVKFQGLFVPRKIHIQHLLYQKYLFLNFVLSVTHVCCNLLLVCVYELKDHDIPRVLYLSTKIWHIMYLNHRDDCFTCTLKVLLISRKQLQLQQCDMSSQCVCVRGVWIDKILLISAVFLDVAQLYSSKTVHGACRVTVCQMILSRPRCCLLACLLDQEQQWEEKKNENIYILKFMAQLP